MWRVPLRDFAIRHVIHVRFNRWAEAGVSEQVAAGLQTLGAGRHAPGHPGAGPHARQVLRPRGGRAQENGAPGQPPLARSTELQATHRRGWRACSAGILICSGGRRSGRPRPAARARPGLGRPALLMDRAYEDDRTRRLAVELGYEPVVPPKSNRRRPWTYDAQRFRRIGTRYDKLDVIFLCGICLALIYDPAPSMRIGPSSAVARELGSRSRVPFATWRRAIASPRQPESFAPEFVPTPRRLARSATLALSSR